MRRCPAADGPEWELIGGQAGQDGGLCPSFVGALAFVGQVGELAEEANHHPDIDIRYNRVTLALMTHDSGGITRLDLDLARAIDGVGTGVGPADGQRSTTGPTTVCPPATRATRASSRDPACTNRWSVSKVERVKTLIPARARGSVRPATTPTSAKSRGPAAVRARQPGSTRAPGGSQVVPADQGHLGPGGGRREQGPVVGRERPGPTGRQPAHGQGLRPDSEIQGSAAGGGTGLEAATGGQPTGRSHSGNQRSRSVSTVRSSATRLLSLNSCSMSRCSLPSGTNG